MLTKIGTNAPVQKWTTSGDKGNNWMSGAVEINEPVEVNVIFEGKFDSTSPLPFLSSK